MNLPHVSRRSRMGGALVVSRGAVSLVFAALVAAVVGCRQFQQAPGTPGKAQVVRAVESVLKERYYQTRVFAGAGHAVAMTPIELEGTYPVMRLIDVHIIPERTGHYMPRVYVRKYIDIGEPPLEPGNGDGFTHFNVRGNPFAGSNWKPIIYDHALEMELREAILEALDIPV